MWNWGLFKKNQFIQISLGFLWIFSIIKYCCKAKYMSQLGWFFIPNMNGKSFKNPWFQSHFATRYLRHIPLLVYSLLTTNNQGSKPCSKHQALDGRLESHLGRCPLLGLHKVGTATWWTSQGLKWLYLLYGGCYWNKCKLYIYIFMYSLMSLLII